MGAESKTYSFLSKTDFDELAIQDKFYKVKLYKWHTHMDKPFCELMKAPEKLQDKDMKDFDVIKYATMLENGFIEDDFPAKVQTQSK